MTTLLEGGVRVHSGIDNWARPRAASAAPYGIGLMTGHDEAVGAPQPYNKPN